MILVSFIYYVYLVGAAVIERAPSVPGMETIPSKFIVMTKATSNTHQARSLAIKTVAESAGTRMDHVYHNLGGFAASLTKDQLAQLMQHPDVDYIQEDTEALPANAIIQTNPPWNLGRLSNSRYGAPYNLDYIYEESAGEGVCVYIVDSGIETSHPEFEGRATWVASVVGNQTTDDFGHGTHVAGTVGSKTYGVAKKVNLYAVKIFDKDGRGSASTILAGLDVVLSDAPKRTCSRGIVVNMSVQTPKNKAINEAVKTMIANNFFCAVAAGNGDIVNPNDAGTLSPASVKDACTVGASDYLDRVPSWSNYGKVIDIFAPGDPVLSTWIGETTRNESGTSMATPHIAGLGAYFMREGIAPKQICRHLRNISIKGILTDERNNTVNMLAQNDEV